MKNIFWLFFGILIFSINISYSKKFWNWDLQSIWIYLNNIKDNFEVNYYFNIKDKPFFDFYEKMYQQNTATEIVSIKSAVDNFANYFRQKSSFSNSKNCKSFGKKDVENLLYFDLARGRWLVWKVLNKLLSEDFKDTHVYTWMILSCKRFLSCSDKDLANIDLNTVSLDINSYNLCREKFMSEFLIFINDQSIWNSVKQMNFWDDFFINWSLDDSPYDLLLDVQDIAKLLFEWVENNYISNFVFYAKNPFELANWNDKNNNKSNKFFSNNSNIKNSNNNSLINGKNDNFWNNYVNNDIIIDNDITVGGKDNFVDESNNSLSKDNNLENEVAEKSLVINNNRKCLSNTVISWNDYRSLVNEDDNIYKNIDMLVIDDNENIVSDSDILNNSYNDKNFWTSKSTNIKYKSNLFDNNVWKFISDDLWINDFVEENKWLCWEFDEDKIVDFKLCLIPTTSKPISSSKKVYSIEDIISEIRNVILKLKESGALIKHKYTHEFWETALQDIKLYRIFIFDIVIQVKPLFPNFSSFIANKKDENKGNKERIEQFSNLFKAESMEDFKERNKYVYYFDLELDKIKPGLYPDVNLNSKLIKKYKSSSDNNSYSFYKDQKWFQADIYSKIHSIYNMWLDWNINYWKSITNITFDFYKNSSQLLDKIESDGKK